MSDQDVYADLAGVAEVAAELGVGIHRVKRWLERRESTGCPAPVARLTMGNVYSKAEWKGWYALWWATRAHHSYIRKPLPRIPE